MIRRCFLWSLTALLLLGCSPQKSTYDAKYYLVRHSEKTTEKHDPGLTDEGQQRAQDLADRFAKVSLTAIYSSDYIRTRDTAAPVAAAKGLDITIYDPRDLESLAKTLLAQQGQFLIVGHSNTTPELSRRLGGLEGEPIVEATEYNRLYVLFRRGQQIISRIEPYGD